MKKILFAFLSVLVLASCHILDEKNNTYTTAEKYYTSAERIRTGLNSCYDPVRDIYSATFFLMTEASTDIIYLSSYTRPDANCVIAPSKPGVGETVWSKGYLGVMRANEMAAAIDRALGNAHITEAEHNSLYAEAAIHRAMYYYLLTSTFGDVPFYTEAVTEENRAKIAYLGRTSADDIRDYCIDELMHYLMPVAKGGLGSLPLAKAYNGEGTYRVGAPLGLMLAGKFCLWNERWDDAIKVYEVLEDIYGHFADSPDEFGAQYPLSDIPFSKKYVAESIFEIPNHIEEYGPQEYKSLASYCTPSRSSSEVVTEDDDIDEDTALVSDIYNGISIPEMGGYARTYKSARPTKYFYNELQTYNGFDRRSGEYSAGATEPRLGSGNLAWRWSGYDPDDVKKENRSIRWFNECKSATSRPWLGNKFWCPGMYYNRDGNNYKVFRFAGALLNMAEAQLMSGNADAACKYMNVVRARAGVAPLTPEQFSYDTDAIMEEIRKECARELFGEFQRKFDLVRWGIWYERTLQYNNSAYLPQYIKPYHRYYPIPAQQVAYSGGNLNNNDYLED